MEITIPLHPDTAPVARFRGPLPVSTNFAGIAFHAPAHLYLTDARGPHHAFRSQADSHHRRKARRAHAAERRRMARSPRGALRSATVSSRSFRARAWTLFRAAWVSLAAVSLAAQVSSNRFDRQVQPTSATAISAGRSWSQRMITY